MVWIWVCLYLTRALFCGAQVGRIGPTLTKARESMASLGGLLAERNSPSEYGAAARLYQAGQLKLTWIDAGRHCLPLALTLFVIWA